MQGKGASFSSVRDSFTPKDLKPIPSEALLKFSKLVPILFVSERFLNVSIGIVLL